MKQTSLSLNCLLLLFLFAVGAPTVSYAQDSLSITQLFKLLQEMQQQQQQLNQQNQNYQLRLNLLQDSLKNSTKKILDLSYIVETQRSALERNEAIVRDVTRRVELSDEARYKIIKTNLVSSADLFEQLNDKLNTLYAISQIESYRNLLATLNNPADQSMGFSYNEKMLKLVEQHIAVGKDRNNGQVMQIARAILEQPTVKTFTSAIPIVNVGTSLLSYVSSIAAQRKDLSADNILTFKTEMEKYTGYYSQLNQLNMRFASNLESYQVQNASIHNTLLELTTAYTNSLQFKIGNFDENGNVPVGEYLSNVFRSYNKDEVRKYLEGLERAATKNGKVDYGLVLKQNPRLLDANKNTERAAHLYRQFESLYGQYISMLEENSRGMINVLESAIELGLSSDNAKIRSQIDILRTRKTEAVSGIRRAINIERLKTTVNNLDGFFGGGL
jgi:hypothetical protein